MSELKSLNALIRSYRRVIKQRAKCDRSIKELQEKIKLLHKEQQQLDDQISHTKKLIDHCIRTGETPMEATLMHTREQLSKDPDHNSIKDWVKHWDKVIQNPFIIHTQHGDSLGTHTTTVPEISSSQVNPHVITTNIATNIATSNSSS